MTSKNTCLIIGALLLLGLFVYYCMHKPTKKNEHYVAAGALDHLDSLDSRYELINSPDEAVPVEHFADLVDSGDQARLVKQSRSVGDELRPLERFERLQGDAQVPLTAAHLPAFNIDAANPSVHAFAVQAPRVLLKNRNWMQSDLIRGDIPITMHPNVALIGTSSIGRDAQNLSGLFSDQFKSLYNKMTGRAYKNMPLQVATQGTVGDYIA